MIAPHRRIFLAAGGTGGHLFPAQALAEELSAKGFEISLLTDERVRSYGKEFPASQVHVVPSASLSLSDPVRAPFRLLRLLRGYLASRALCRSQMPSAVIGFGGYPSLPPLVAAAHLGIPTIIHEQNAVMGRANRLLSTRVRAIATSFENVSGIPAPAGAKVQLTGNPVRQRVLSVADRPYSAPDVAGDIRVLVFGGSQGAKFFSDLLPDVLAQVPAELRKRIRLTQQCRSEDLERVKAAYGAIGIVPVLESFFMDLPAIMAESHLVIGRSGASTIAELGVLGRPAILVPLPGAIDNDQLNNARSFAGSGAGVLVEQKDAEIGYFSRVLRELLEAPERLKEAAAAARRHGRPDAARRLAALVETTIAA